MEQLTLKDLNEITGYSIRTIQKKPISNFLTNKKMTNGRPINFYSAEVLKLFPNVDLKSFDYNYKFSNKNSNKNIPTANAVKKSRSDAQSPKRPAGLSLAERIKLEDKITQLSLMNYLSQSNKFNIKGSVELACDMVISIDGLMGFESKDDMLDYYYAKRLMRKDNYYTGSAIKDNWKFLWESNFNAPKTNSLMPKNNWDYINLLLSEGLIGQGYGAGCLWTIDATQLDLWVNNNGKTELTSFFAVMDVVTGFVLHINPIESESIESVIQTIIQCVEKWGVPRFGFILDNSRAFKSKAVQGFINLLYSEDDLKEYSSIKIFKQIFGNNDIVKYPLAKKPQFFGKAKLERVFKEINLRFTTNESRALARQSTTEKNTVKLELGTVPTKALKSAQDYKVIFNEFIEYVYDDYNNEKNHQFKYLIDRNIKPTRANAFLYFGANELKLNPKMPPMTNVSGLIYYKTPKQLKHRITVEKLGQFRIVEKGKQKYYSAEFLTFREMGNKITAIKNPNNEKSVFCYLEYNSKHFDERVKEEGDILYLGEAFSTEIMTKEDLIKIKERQKLQKLQETEIKNAKIIDNEIAEYITRYKLLKNNNTNTKYLDEAKDLINSKNLLNANNTNYENNYNNDENIKSEIEDYYDELTNILNENNIETQNVNETNTEIENETNNQNQDLDNIDDLFDFKF